TAWRTVVVAEEANYQPRALAWVRPQLDQAAASLHEARILLLPDATGFASWNQIKGACDDARDKYRLVGGRERARQDGQATLARSMAVLVSMIPYLGATRLPEQQSDWLETADRAGVLARLLEPPEPGQPSAEAAGSLLDDATQQLGVQVEKLL